MRKSRWIIALAPLLMAAVAALVVFAPTDPLRSAERREWRDQAVAKVQHRFDDKSWVDSELQKLKPRAASRRSWGGWVGDELLLMKNGEWIVCQNVCGKEQKQGLMKDLFIGRGSDGRWYYSTFHFCVHKCALDNEGQPASLAQFVDAYWLAPFDGKSDDSLKVTWDGGPYGDEKLQSTSAVSSPH
jgi:hypothetical protein